MNPLDNYYSGSAFSEGNVKVITASSPWCNNQGTIGLTAGKWYWEIKATTVTANSMIGIATMPATSTADYPGNSNDSWAYYASTGTMFNVTGGSYNNTSWGDGWNTNGLIIGVALDLDNNRLYFARSNVWQDSADPTDGTNALTIIAPALTAGGQYTPCCGDYDNASQFTYEANFGNPSYANSSDAADGNGYGKFEYAPPSGYLAICTKNLGSDGG
jgi:hypothetical protein